MNPDRPKELLTKHMTGTLENLSSFLDESGIHQTALADAMNMFIHSLLDLPKEAACKNGCAYCCHLRVGVSIPEAVVLFNELKTQAGHQDLDFLKNKIILTGKKGNVMEEAWWLKTQTACPFLDTETQNQCLIYALRPFSCRAYHSTDQTACRKGFENRKETQIPCFPLYRAFTDMYSTVFIQAMARKGLHSYQVGFVRALQILFEDDMTIDQWFQGKDVFMTAKLF